MSSTRRTLLALLLLLPLAASAQPTASRLGPVATGRHLDGVDTLAAFTLTVLHNNDGESKLVNAGSTLPDFGGVARFATVVDHLKTTAEATTDGYVLLSSGDNFLAGPEFQASLNKGAPYYDALALDLIGYDALAIGNHEFDFGPEVLATFIASFSATQPPFLSANLDVSGEPSLASLRDAGRIARSTVVTVHGEPVGIIGATTPALPFISSPRNVTVAQDVAAAVNAEAALLTSQGVNKIILISHLQTVAEDEALVPLLTGVDLVIAGGGSEVLANPGDLLVPGDLIYGPYPLLAVDGTGTTVPIITTEGSYKYVGQFVAQFDAAGNLVGWDDAASGPVRVAGGAQVDAVEPDAAVQAAVVDPVVAALAVQAATIVAVTEVPLDGLRTSVRTMETNLGDLIADAFVWQANVSGPLFGAPPATVGLQNGGGIRNNTVLPAGPISELNTFSILPFANFVSIVPEIGPAQFKELLENAVSRVEFSDGRFAQISGFTLVYDPTRQPQVLDLTGTVTQVGERVRAVALADGTPIIANGQIVPQAPSVNMATIDFLARGGDQYPFRGAPFTSVGVSYQQALLNYLENPLDSLVQATAYPAGGAGRIQTVAGLTVDAEPTSTTALPAEGGRLAFTVEVTNTSSTARTTQVWPVFFTPTGRVSLAGSVQTVTLAPGASQSLTYKVRLPANRPNGTYTLTAYAGTYPSLAAVGDSFEVTKGSADRLAAETAEAPAETRLVGTYPNPFNPATTVAFTLAEAGPVQMKVYDVLGRQVATLVDEHRTAGTYEVRFDATAFPSGVYLVHLQAAGRTFTQRLTLIK